MAASIDGGGNRSTLRKLKTYHRPSHKVASSIARPAHIDCKIDVNLSTIMVITKLPNSEQSYKGKVKTHKYINRQNQSTTGKL